MAHGMTNDELLTYAREFMDKHGLRHWSVALSHGMSTAGWCYDRKRLISLAYKVMENWSLTDVRDIILHEIAHALTPRDKGHGASWKAKCVEIGANPKRCYDESLPTPEGKWIESCECGDNRDRAHRRSAGSHFWDCGHRRNYRLEGQPLSAAKPYDGSVAAGSPEWAKAKTIELGGRVEGGDLFPPDGYMWAMTETHCIDMSLDSYSDDWQTAAEARKMLKEDVLAGFMKCHENCGCS